VRSFYIIDTLYSVAKPVIQAKGLLLTKGLIRRKMELSITCKQFDVVPVTTYMQCITKNSFVNVTKLLTCDRPSEDYKTTERKAWMLHKKIGKRA